MGTCLGVISTERDERMQGMRRHCSREQPRGKGGLTKGKENERWQK